MPFATQPAAQPVTRRDRRRLGLVCAAVLLVFAAAGIWAVVHPGGYGASRAGCITVMLPSSTGGGLLHACGSRARADCRHAYHSSGKVSRLTRPQCRLAGLLP
jgi:hypothetical protein